MKKTLLIVFAAATFISSCDDKETANRVLENNGYTNIELTGYKAFCCSEDDTFSTGFTATAPNGKTVSGCVCSTVYTKGATIRFE
jgi:hypothetical protein